MENEVSKDYLENAIKRLDEDLGIKKEADHKEIVDKIKTGDKKKAINLIARQLDLPIKLNILTVSQNRGDSLKSKGVNFQSTSLTRVKSHKEKGAEGIAAQVEIPSNLPNYGSTRLIDFPINVKVKKSIKHPSAFAVVIAHELSHVLLYSQDRDYKNNEFYTDLTVLMLGFRNLYREGREITKTKKERTHNKVIRKTRTTTYGYLNKNQFNFSIKKIDTILAEKKNKKETLIKKLNKTKKRLTSYKRLVYRFNNFFQHLKTNCNTKISQGDINKISKFYYSNFSKNLQEEIEENEEKVNGMLEFCEKVNHFDSRRMKKINSQLNKVDSLLHSLTKKINSLHNKVKPLKRNTNLFKIAKIYLKSFIKFNSFKCLV
jgi:hypothetical protein